MNINKRIEELKLKRIKLLEDNNFVRTSSVVKKESKILKEIESLRKLK